MEWVRVVGCVVPAAHETARTTARTATANFILLCGVFPVMVSVSPACKARKLLFRGVTVLAVNHDVPTRNLQKSSSLSRNCCLHDDEKSCFNTKQKRQRLFKRVA